MSAAAPPASLEQRVADLERRLIELAQLLGEEQAKQLSHPSMETILQVVARHYQADPRGLRARRHGDPWMREARMVAMHLCRQLTARSFPTIGRFFSTDHSTPQYANKRAIARAERDRELARRIAQIAAQITHAKEMH